jgi:hypothetical protein
MTEYSQPGIFNAQDYGMSPGNTGAYNAQCLQAAIDAAQESGNTSGAIVLIPSFEESSPLDYGAYYMDTTGSAAITIPTTGYDAYPLLICGTGSGTTLIMEANDSSTSLFDVSNNSWVTFQDLTVVYQISSEGVGGLGTAFNFNSSSGLITPPPQSFNLFRVNVVNCQEPVVFNRVAIATMVQCSITYESYPTQACTGVKILGGSSDICIKQCALVYNGTSSSSTVGISVGASTGARISDTQISGFANGITLQSSSGSNIAQARFTALEIDAYTTCVSIGAAVYDVSFLDCRCSPSSATPTGSGIVLSASSNSGIDTVTFTSCVVSGYTSGYYGMQIATGQNIQINGGYYSGNGSAGIAVTGGAAEIQINGASCLGVSYAQSSSTTQQAGIYITSGEDIQITGVNCSGNGTSESAGSGILIAGPAATPLQNIRIVGAICTGATLGSSSATQRYGVSASGAANIVIDGCLLTGNTGAAVNLGSVQYATVNACDIYSNASATAKGIIVAGSLLYPADFVFIRNCNAEQFASSGFSTIVAVGANTLNVEVANCAGYNDQGVELAHSTSAPTGAFSGRNYGYFGPTAFYVASSSATVMIDGESTFLHQGGFTLAPGETAQVSGTTTAFLVVGK